MIFSVFYFFLKQNLAGLEVLLSSFPTQPLKQVEQQVQVTTPGL